MSVHCYYCGSYKFRVSRIRPVDLLHLFCFRYPVRCRLCNKRRYTSISEAMQVHKSDRARHHHPHTRPVAAFPPPLPGAGEAVSVPPTSPPASKI